MKTININKVIREIELRRLRRDKFTNEQLAYNDGLKMAIQIIKDNIKEVEESKFTDKEIKLLKHIVKVNQEKIEQGMAYSKRKI